MCGRRQLEALHWQEIRPRWEPSATGPGPRSAIRDARKKDERIQTTESEPESEVAEEVSRQAALQGAAVDFDAKCVLLCVCGNAEAMWGAVAAIEALDLREGGLYYYKCKVCSATSYATPLSPYASHLLRNNPLCNSASPYATPLLPMQLRCPPALSICPAPPHLATRSCERNLAICV